MAKKSNDKKEVKKEEITSGFPIVIDKDKHIVSGCNVSIVDLDKKLFRKRHVSLVDGKHIAMDHLIDLSNMDLEEVYYHAVNNIVIQIFRRRFLDGMKLNDVLAKVKTSFTFDPTKYPAERKTADLATKSARIFEKMTPMQKYADLIAKGIDPKTASAVSGYQPK